MAISGVPLLSQLPLTTIIQAVTECKGRLSYAAKRLGIHERTLYDLQINNAEFRKNVEKIRRESAESEIDACEDKLSQIMQMLKERPDVALKAIQFYMNNKGRQRGYGASQDKAEEERVSGALAMIRAIRVAGGGDIALPKAEEVPALELKVEPIVIEEGEEKGGDLVITKKKAERKRKEEKPLEPIVKRFSLDEFRQAGKKVIDK